jgi:hypothetical protein
METALFVLAGVCRYPKSKVNGDQCISISQVRTGKAAKPDYNPHWIHTVHADIYTVHVRSTSELINPWRQNVQFSLDTPWLSIERECESSFSLESIRVRVVSLSFSAHSGITTSTLATPTAMPSSCDCCAYISFGGI